MFYCLSYRINEIKSLSDYLGSLINSTEIATTSKTTYLSSPLLLTANCRNFFLVFTILFVNHRIIQKTMIYPNHSKQNHLTPKL